MARKMTVIPSKVVLDISSDTSSNEDDHFSYDSLELNDSSILGELSVSQLQNRPSSTDSNSTIDSLTTDLQKLHINTEKCKNGLKCKDSLKNQGRRRLTRPAIAPNTFEVLATVPEDEPHRASTSATKSVSGKTQHLELPASAEKLSNHPLVALARKGIPPAKEQIAKHRDGWFEGIISSKFPITTPTSNPTTPPELKKVHFGFNLLPIQDSTEHGNPNEVAAPVKFTILLTPLAPGEEILADIGPTGEGNMALAEANTNHHLAPVKELEASSIHGTRQPRSTSTSPATNREKRIEGMAPRSPAQPVARIEDSVEALDKLEEQLEAFDVAAHFRRIVSPDGENPENKSSMQSLSVKTSEAKRSVTPQPKRTTPSKAGTSSVRVKAASEPRRTVRKAASMIFLDSPKMNGEDKSTVQAPSRKSITRGIASLLPPKQPPKSTKKPTIPTFELPGDEVARKLKEKREARVSTQFSVEQLTKPTVSSLRRAKSARTLTRPNFELPGEAISRRKREEREAQLKAQEEEERKRREFKARPIRSGGAPSTFPRETVASRARQNKGHLVENSAQQIASAFSKDVSPVTNTSPRPPLSKTNNQTQPRGRGLHPDPIGVQPIRGTSSSTNGSTSAQRSSVSTEDVQQQRIRGQEIYKRDNSWTGEREREKREREALAKLAREEAAERSRQQSREWAAKQARKRMTIASLRDVMT
ncbi:uncharacterized protein GGS22DRAFT_44855 [Annulohypoxylon maeteangense]|uniref:uncharacterized protein n=1 Tax=Annulohypoxylon maeteangense TaxID=1927788 RepID=UPI002008AB2B|nr:uncharacterized protein GGS22DRAFT_44855 [Annulohypoxylon maeteangense]KAI0882471.1 hypothetical protein GGS22DRAFT_44855 [Annulohypoxylon maeteangense]